MVAQSSLLSIPRINAGFSPISRCVVTHDPSGIHTDRCPESNPLETALQAVALPSGSSTVVSVASRRSALNRWRQHPEPLDERAVSIVSGQCVGTELNRQSPKAGGLRPLDPLSRFVFESTVFGSQLPFDMASITNRQCRTSAQPTQLNPLTRVGVEPTNSQRFELRRFSRLRTASLCVVKKRPRGDLNP